MSTRTEKNYQAVLLADAAYVTFPAEGYLDGNGWENPLVRNRLLAPALDQVYTSKDVPFGAVESGRGWSEAQFDEFSSRYLVVYHQPDQDNGFSATLFYDTQDEKHVVSFRGTNEVYPDIAPSDLLLALGLSSLGPEEQHSSISAFFEGAGLVDASGAVMPEIAGKVDMVGHSLGGYLALWAMYEFRDLFAEVFTFNGAGISAIPGTPDFEYINDLMRDNPLTDDQQSRIHNLFAQEGPELTANDLTFFRPGQRQGVFIERDDPLGTVGFHSAGLLIDSLAVASLFTLIDENMSQGDIDKVLYAMSNESLGSLGKAVMALSELLGEDYQFAGIEDAGDFRQALLTARGENESMGGQFKLLVDETAVALAANARNTDDVGRGYRYALDNLLPFALISEVVDSELSLPAYDLESYTDRYLNDRALFLSTLLRMGSEDRAYGDLKIHGHFSDLEQELAFNSDAISYGNGDISDLRARLAFGSRGNDVNTLLASSQDDRLYGMDGDDTIAGLAGSDHIEGGDGDDELRGGPQGDVLLGGSGADSISGGPGSDLLAGGQGSDRFVWNSGDGDDVISDYDDGGDAIVVNGTDLSSLSFQKLTSDSSFYIDPAHPDIRLHYEGGVLGVNVGTGPDTGTINVAQYSPVAGADFGIVLNGASEVIPTTELVVSRLGSGDDEVDPHAFTRQELSQGSIDWPDTAIRFDTEVVENYSAGDLHGTLRGAFEGGPVGDFLTGGEGSNALHGLAGADLLDGGAGDDFLEGGAGADVLHGRAGDDLLFGSARAGLVDSLVEGLPSDQFYLSQLVDGIDDTNILAGGIGDDGVSGGEYSDYIDGGAGSDYLLAGAGADSVSGGDGRDVIYGDSSLHYRYLEPGPGVLGEQLEIAFADGLSGHGEYDDIVHAGAGHDTVWGELGDDKLYGGGGDDDLIGDRYNDPEYFALELPAYGASAPALSQQMHGDDQLYGGAGNDVLLGLGGNDLLAGGEGTDSLLGGAGNDSYQMTIGGGLDRIDDTDGIHTLVFSDIAASELKVSFQGSQVFVGTRDGAQGFILPRNEWHSTRVGLGTADAIVERSALDTHYFGAAGDLLLTVNASSAVSESERDALFTVDAANTESPRIVVNESVDEVEIDALSGGSEGATMRVVSGGLQLILDLAVMQLDTGLDFLGLADGVLINLVGFSGGMSGSAGDDWIIGSAGADRLYGGSGDDILEGRGGDDDIDGGSNNDRLIGGEGNDLLYGGPSNGRDYLTGGTGNDSLNGGPGPDTYRFTAGDGQDLLTDPGGYHFLEFESGVNPDSVALYYTGVTDSNFRLEYAAGDTLTSQGGLSSYWIAGVTVGADEIPLVQHSDLADGTFRDTRWNDVFEPGYGHDVIHINGWGDDAISLAAGNALDTVKIDNNYYPEYMAELRLADNVDLNELAFSFEGGDAVIMYGAGDQARLESDTQYSILDNSLARFTLVSEADPDWVPVIHAQEGADTLHGSYGADHIVGGGDRDVIVPGYGDDVIEAGGGHDRIVLNDIYMYQAPAGIGHKTISGQGGDDIFDVPLHQGLTFRYEPGDGNDTINYDWSYAWGHPYLFNLDWDTGTAVFQPHGEDSLVFGAGISLADMRLTRVDDALEIALPAFDGSVKIDNFFAAWDVQDRYGGRDLFALLGDEVPLPDTMTDPVILDVLPRTPIATLQFADGTIYTMASLLDDYLDVAAATLIGTDGPDLLTGTESSDILIGGRGNDVMDGAGGDDFFQVEGRRQGKDRIIGGAGYDILGGGERDDRIGLLELSPLDGLERIDGGGGFNTIVGTGAANILDFSGTELNSIAAIEGRGGRDTITGSSGDDVLIGGKGRDVLSGASGNDTYLFGPGEGRDVISNADSDPSSMDSLRMDEIDYDQVWLSRKRNHLVMTVAGTTDRVLLKNWYEEDAAQLDTIHAGGHVLMRNQVDQLVNAMAAFEVPAGAGAIIPQQARMELEPMLASVWQLAG